ncbi:MAG TPA: iron-sulfur cluster assembly scaffold protein [Dehalococcoidia bacterium]|nr:iron-sulfur cluster assembly scaffold protein [Dehalococcoidia bacterium]
MSESYSDIVLDHAQNPRNRGILEDANARGYQMNPVCGDTLVLMLRIEDDHITEARFQTEGCTASVATSSLITEMVTGLTLDEAMALTHEDVSEEVGGLPASKLHSAALVIGGLRRAIDGYKQSAEHAAAT